MIVRACEAEASDELTRLNRSPSRTAEQVSSGLAAGDAALSVSPLDAGEEPQPEAAKRAANPSQSVFLSVHIVFMRPGEWQRPHQGSLRPFWTPASAPHKAVIRSHPRIPLPSTPLFWLHLRRRSSDL